MKGVLRLTCLVCCISLGTFAAGCSAPVNAPHVNSNLATQSGLKTITVDSQHSLSLISVKPKGREAIGSSFYTIDTIHINDAHTMASFNASNTTVSRTGAGLTVVHNGKTYNFSPSATVTRGTMNHYVLPGKSLPAALQSVAKFSHVVTN
jgi:hypothetical protein